MAEMYVIAHEVIDVTLCMRLEQRRANAHGCIAFERTTGN
mgnify:CR=1 FL=1|jgi:hypothetical protein